MDAIRIGQLTRYTLQLFENIASKQFLIGPIGKRTSKLIKNCRHVRTFIGLFVRNENQSVIVSCDSRLHEDFLDAHAGIVIDVFSVNDAIYLSPLVVKSSSGKREKNSEFDGANFSFWERTYRQISSNCSRDVSGVHMRTSSFLGNLASPNAYIERQIEWTSFSGDTIRLG